MQGCCTPSGPNFDLKTPNERERGTFGCSAGCCAGNEAINLHREGSVELLMLALDYYDHTEDKIEFGTSILPLR